jgi:chemotaxis protein methyltransferase CheR
VRPARSTHPESLPGLRRLIHAKLGIKMPAGKIPMLESRLRPRLAALGLDSLTDYQRHLATAANLGEEIGELTNLVTTNKTDFFRESTHFDYVVQRALPELGILPGGAAAYVRAWCAGCSSGEEPYTLAMILAEYGRGDDRFRFQILATDISTRVLDLARAGIYPADRVAAVPPALRARYVMRSLDRSRPLVRIVPALRSRISFHALNFMDESYDVSDTFDLVFFRNVAIYFDAPTQQAVVEKLCRHLRPGGFFFIGQSESLTGLDLPLQRVGPSIFRRA